MEKTVCFRLVTAAVTSQWGVIFSTLALCLGRAMQMGSAHVELPNSVEYIMVPAAVVMVAVLHIMTILLSDLSLSIKMIHRLKPEQLCPIILTSTEMFPRRIMGYIIVMVLLVIITSTIVIVTNLRRRPSVFSLGGTLQVGDVARLQQYLRPFEELVPPQINNNGLLLQCNQPTIDCENFNENTGNIVKGEHSSSLSQTTTADDTSSSMDGSWAQDLYDYERRRHGIHSDPPPGTSLPLAQVSAALLPDHAVQRRHQDLIPGLDAALPPNDHLAGVPIDRAVDDAPFPLLPDIILWIMFPHRNTVNKPRFPYTLTRRSRRVTWPTSQDVYRRLDHAKPYPVDVLLCVTGVLFTINYFPMAVYLIYTSDDQQYPFLDLSFQPFVIIILLKNSIESLVYFIGIQCFPWLV